MDITRKIISDLLQFYANFLKNDLLVYSFRYLIYINHNVILNFPQLISAAFVFIRCQMLSLCFCSIFSNDVYFTGTTFVRPADIPHSPTRLFYRRELFLSSQETVHPISRISGRCCVLHLKEYCCSKCYRYQSLS